MKTAVFLLANVLTQHAFALTEVPMTTRGNTRNDVIACSTDEECGNNKHCEMGDCVRDDIICYNDEECPNGWICDMGTYICVEPTTTESPTTTVTTDAPGCCHGGSYKANDKCSMALTADKCESKDCTWLETTDPEDCVITSTETPTTTAEAGCCKGTSYQSNADCNLGATEKECGRKCEWITGGDLAEGDCDITTTSTPTLEPGCCDSDSAKSFDLCNAKLTEAKCSMSSSCHWNSGADAVCEPPSTTSEPGCCFGNPDSAYSSRWMTACVGYYTERECLFNLDELANARCRWEALPETYDCSMLWPTTTSTPTEPIGCCHGGSYKANEKCSMAMTADKCESKDCTWLETDDPTDCIMTTTETPTTTAEEGCCKGTSYQSNAECNFGATEKECGRKCEWITGGDLAEGDCDITTTSSPTTTEEVGCCDSDSAKKFEMCNANEEKTACERSSSCFWTAGADAECEPPSTTRMPGCCYINPGVAYTSKGQKACIGYGSENECLHNEGLCYWEETEDDEDCEQYWPTTTTSPTTTEEVGCCQGTSYLSNEECNAGLTAKTCGRKCEWITGGVLAEGDCDITTTNTPTTTAEEGCCRGTSYQSNPDCNLGLTEKMCGRKCEWVSGGVLDLDCAVTTTTSSPTTTEVGCCKGDSLKATEKCNALSSSSDCDRMSSCNWVEDGEVERDCGPPTTTANPGCCYGNPAAAYSSRWMEACKTFFTENECLMLTDDLSLARCFWEPLGTYEDCEQTWPTTTSSEEAGCCYGDSYKANDKCMMALEQEKCESKSCKWMVTEDPEDCVVTTTESPTTTIEAGCCKGGSYQSNAECNLGETEKTCGRKCEWIPGGVLEEDCAMTTTTSSPTTTEVGCCKGTSYLSNGECNLGATEKACGRKCEWITGGVVEVDCAITTTSTPLTTTSTPEVGCCKGTSFMSNPDCNEMTSSHSCGRKCEWVVDGVVEVDCAMETPSPTEPETGCCKGETYTSNLACNEKDVEESCSRSGKCEWIKNGDVEVECFMDATTPSPEEPTTTAPAGCCYGASYKANDKCLKSTVEHMCTQNGCEWMETEDPEDCVVTTTSSPSTTSSETTESGCCAGTSASNTEMCNEKVGRESCERSGKCAFRAGEDDCAWPTTTSEPWLGAKGEADYKLPVNPYARSSKQRRAEDHKQESVLFGGQGAIAETMQSTVSLSTLLMMVAAAFAAFQLYRCIALRKAAGYSKLADAAPQTPTYQSV